MLVKLKGNDLTVSEPEKYYVICLAMSMNLCIMVNDKGN